MQISELTKQYNSTTSSPEAMSGTRGIQNLVSTVRDLTAGNIFEGTINSIKNGQVVLGLSNGTELAARLDANMQLVAGQSMFFQVKSNNGETIAIRPYTVDGTGANLTLLSALKAAGLPVQDRYLNMANTMMQENMPIDKNSMMQMARTLMANPDMSVRSLVQMKKFNLPITPESVSQFENYVDDKNAIHTELDKFVTKLPDTLVQKNMPLEQLKNFESQFLEILAEGIEIVQEGETAQIQSLNVTEQTIEENLPKTVEGNIIETGNIDEKAVVSSATGEINAEGILELGQASADTIAVEAAEEEGKITQPLQKEEVSKLEQQKLIKLVETVLGEVDISPEDSKATILQKLSHFIANDNGVTKESLLQLFSSKEMKLFLKEVVEEQFFLKPEDVKSEEVEKLFERLSSKTQKLETLLQSAGLKDIPLSQTIADVHSNIEFMNQVNQAYTYVQIPLKMSGQNASGQLYVYTNKRDLEDKDRDLTAFLHLDMDNLGATDISVRMQKREVDTKFYMESDASFALIKEHKNELEARLKAKGYNCKIEVSGEGKKVNFVDDFLKKDAPSAGQLHRYSFDVRA